MPVDIPFTDLAEVNPGRGLKRGERYPFIEMASVLEGGGRPTHHDEREFDGGGSRFAVGDTLFARITPCTENGKIAFVDALPDGSVGFGSTELIVLSARPGKADPRFVYQVAASGRVRRQAIARMLGTSGRQRVPTWFFTEELTVPDFSLAEQRAIAAVLDAIDDTIERTEAVIAATKELRRALLNELLTRGVPGWHSEWKDVPGIGIVPASWEVVRLGDVAEVMGGSTPSRTNSEYWGGSVPWAIPSELTELKSRYLTATRESITDAGMKSAGLIAIPTGSILLTSRATIGVTAINTMPVVTNQGFQNLVVKNGIDSLWLYYGVSAMRRELERRAAGSTFLEVSRDSVRTLPILLPPLAEQRAIAAILDAIDDTIERRREERDGLQLLKASAADALLAGRLRVTTEVIHA